MPAFGKILVLRGGAIGDFILTLPVLAALRQNFPRARLEILGYPRIAQLALAGGLADAVYSIESPELAGFFVCDGELHPKWTSYFSQFDLILSYVFDPEQILVQNIKRCSPARFIPAPHRPNENENLHATEVFLTPLKQLEIFQPSSTLRLVFSADHSPCTTLAIHPGSGSEKKNWPEEKWSELLQWLASNVKCSLLLIGGEAEGEKLNRLALALPSSRIELAQNLPLTELTKKLSTASFFLGHDSGITHLAAALALPGLVLWGESNFEIWHPRSDQMKILRAGKNLKTLAVETVIQEIAQRFREHGLQPATSS